MRVIFRADKLGGGLICYYYLMLSLPRQETPDTVTLPSQARAVIIGGGIMGCALAYHLADEGWDDIVLLEKAELTSGSTWHAAGQLTYATSSQTMGKCVAYNIDLYNRLEQETGIFADMARLRFFAGGLFGG